MGVSLSGVRGWSANVQLPIGTYPTVLVDKERDSSRNDNPLLVLDWRVTGGEWAGSEKQDRLTFTDSALGRVVQFLEAVGIEVPAHDFPNMEALRDWVDGQLKVGVTKADIVLREGKQYQVPAEKRDDSNDDGWRTPIDVKGYLKPMPGGMDVPNGEVGFAGRVPQASSTCRKAGCDRPVVKDGFCEDHPIPFLWDGPQEYVDLKAHATRPL